MSVSILIAGVLLAAALLSGPAAAPGAATEQAKAAEKKTVQAKPAASRELQPVVTRHKVTIAGKKFSYRATAGQLPVVNDAGETEAQLFFVSYTADGSPAGKRRPLMFALNGGPGAAAVWLHLGTMGPRRVEMLPDGRMPAPPFRLVDNQFSWLDRADLVFIDPVGTGYSRASKPELTQKFTAVRHDVEVVGKFIRLYLARYGGWDRPLFLVGESYGAFRAAGLSEYLVEHGIALNGLILVSAIMNLQTTSFDQGNDLPYMLFLPSYAATAWYHGRLAPGLQADLEKTLMAAEEWAATGYLTALARGDRLSEEERRGVAEKLASFTGLDREYIDNRNLRIDSKTFVRELLRERREMVGYMDSRFTAANVDPAAPSGFDATVAVIRPPYTAMINHYLRTELGYRSDLEYFVLGGGIGRWDWEAKNSYADTSENLRNTFAKNPHMKLFVASGWFDLATPHFATRYTLDHLGLTPALRQKITTRYYRAGHMMYLEKESLESLKRDVAEFIDAIVSDK